MSKEADRKKLEAEEVTTTTTTTTTKKPATTGGAPKKKTPMEECLEMLTGLCGDFKVRIDDHEDRLRELELCCAKMSAGKTDKPAPVDPPKSDDPAPKKDVPAEMEPAPKKDEPVCPAAPAAELSGYPGRAFKYYDWKSGTYGLTPDIWKAKQIGGDYTPVWVWYDECGQIDHKLTTVELEKYVY